MLICLDTSLLILTQQQNPSPGHKNLFEAARAYEEWLAETDWGVLIPTPVISEFLTSRDAKTRREVLTTLQTFAQIAELDLRAAEFAARLRFTYYEKYGLPKNKNNRQVLTVDMMIAAIAMVNRASIIITHDIDDFERIVDGFEDFNISIRGVAEGPPGQGKLL